MFRAGRPVPGSRRDGRLRPARRAIVATGVAGVIALTAGCVSAADRSGPVSTQADATAAAERTCSLLNAEELGRVLGLAFKPPIVDPSSTQTAVQCQWTATDQSALVLTKVVTDEADVVFRTTVRESQRSIGAVQNTKIPGATRAFVLPSLGRTGMLVGDSYVEVSVLVPSATPPQIEDIATAAARAAKSDS